MEDLDGVKIVFLDYFQKLSGGVGEGEGDASIIDHYILAVIEARIIKC